MKELSNKAEDQSVKKSLKSGMLLGVSIIALGSTVQNLTMFAASVAGMSLISSHAFAGGDGGGDGGSGDGGGGGGGGGNGDGGGGSGDGGGGDGGGDGDGGSVMLDPCNGTMSRLVQCRDFRGNVVADSFCDRVGTKPVATRQCEATCQTSTNSDPLIFDLDDNGISLVSADDGVMFDIDNDGEPDKTGWVAKGDGMLAIDDNGNGIIDNQSELFGTEKKGAYKQLAEYDSNDDGVINKDDKVWKHLRMWIDGNSNGKTDSGELKTMKDLKMTSIDLDYKTVDEVDAGNKVTGVGTFTRWVHGAGKVVSKVIEAFFDFIA